MHLKVPSSLLITFIEPHKIHLQKSPRHSNIRHQIIKGDDIFNILIEIFFAISLNKCKSKVQFVTYVLLYDKKKKLRTYQRALLGSRGASRQGAKRELMDVVCIAHINTIKDPLSFGLTVSHK